ncbi:hypothetical protein [Solimonas variicoloris]|uniref:hypothetical protein n=1 Tax=Solimonas variicoloris TaxID=254408 RepID=UPI00037BF007|nr:hypothetical protein [Solimonas variicoloris]
MAAPLAGAGQLDLPAAETAPESKPIVLPQRGQAQASVLREFGEPRARHAPAGGGSAQHPPITRWDYDGYSVFFERTTVIDVVTKGDPPPLSHVDELAPAQ